MFFLNNKKGFTVFFITILVLIAAFGVIVNMTFVSYLQSKILRNAVSSSRAYYAAEAGLEDALLRFLKMGMPCSDPNTLLVGDALANVSVENISTSLTVLSQGHSFGMERTLEIKARVVSGEVSFCYGVQVGEGGLTMKGNAEILGNIYSNGSITGDSNTKIYGDVYSAGETGLIDSMKIFKSGSGEDDGNAYANTISGSNIENGAYYQNIIGTTAGAYYPLSPDPEYENMPISEEQITAWKNDAEQGGVITGYYLGGSDEDSLGPIKVEGDFEMDSNAVLTQTGTIWVTGDIILGSNSVIELDSSYGLDSGTIIADGRILLNSNVVICGSEGYKKAGKCYNNQGSFLMLLSTNNSLDPYSPAISSTSNSNAAIFYASQGMIRLDSNSYLKEVTGYALYLDSNASVVYESGLANVNFVTGPGGSWEIQSWKEIE